MTDSKDDKRESDRKERVLHTRVPAVLEQELKRLAGSLRVPVSNVVRTILEDAVTTLDQVGRAAEDGVRDVANRLSKGRDRLRSKAGESVAPLVDTPEPAAVAPLQGVIGFQLLRLARREACTLCGAPLEPGQEAHLGIRDGGGPRVLLGAECLPGSARGAVTQPEVLPGSPGAEKQENDDDDRTE
jgi:hypothetical protein